MQTSLTSLSAQVRGCGGQASPGSMRSCSYPSAHAKSQPLTARALPPHRRQNSYRPNGTHKRMDDLGDLLLEFKMALKGNPGASSAWAKQSRADQYGCLDYVKRGSTAEGRQKRIQHVVETIFTS